MSERPAPHRRPAFVAGMLYLAAVAIIVAHVRGLQNDLVRTQALQNAELLTGVVAEFRTVYTSEVVERLRMSGTEVTHDYLRIDGAVPLPATMTMILGDRIGALGSGGETRLYSPFPFPCRGSVGELTDPFVGEAWRSLTQNPGEPFYRLE